MEENGTRAVLSLPKTTAAAKKAHSGDTFLGRTRYKFWVLAAVTLLAVWSMLTGSVNLEWSIGNLKHLSDTIEFQTHDDFDILEVEEKEKVVRRMWDVYTHSASTKLPRFWRQAFEAAYEALASDVPAEREAAVHEIAKLSIRSSNVELLPLQQATKKSSKQRQQNKKA